MGTTATGVGNRPMTALQSLLAPRAASASMSDRDRAARIFAAGRSVLPILRVLKPVTVSKLREIMTEAFGTSDTSGVWVWRDAYEACEVAQALYVRTYGARIVAAGAGAAVRAADMLTEHLPSQTRRSEEQIGMQQFSTPLALAMLAGRAAAMTTDDVVMEPSCGTGMLAAQGAAAGCALVLNEMAGVRAHLAGMTFPGTPVTMFDGATINDRLDSAVRPSVVLINPPFSVSAGRGKDIDAGWLHIRSALLRLRPGGRMVAIHGAWFARDWHKHTDAWREINEVAHVRLVAQVPGKAFQRHGTSVETCFIVLDKRESFDRTPRADITAMLGLKVDDLAQLARLVDALPARMGTAAPPIDPPKPVAPQKPRRAPKAKAPSRLIEDAIPEQTEGVPVDYTVVPLAPADRALADAIYVPYQCQRIRIPGAAEHPSPLVQSAALASVAPPAPSYRPLVLPGTVARGVLSEAQLESLIYAGQAHQEYLPGAFVVGGDHLKVDAAPEDAAGAVRFRRGWFLGDGTGTGKGRQVAGILMDNWLRGRTKAVWLSASDKLIEDARRDWAAIGGNPHDIHSLARWKQNDPIGMPRGILFVTYATLRVGARKDKRSRLDQILEWLGDGFSGVIAFDESHAMANAAPNSGATGNARPGKSSEQGRAGLKIQNALPDARVLYVSATGATDLKNLAYTSRLGLWGTEALPFPTREDFVTKIGRGGVAAMEMVCRDLKSLGLYTARSLSFDGVEYETLIHQLTDPQIETYDEFAEAFAVIHHNLQRALRVTNIVGPGGTWNKDAKSAAMSAFESAKQRFFLQMVTAMKCPSLLAAIDRDIADGHAVIVQIVTTGEAVMDRRLADIPASEHDDLNVDLTPREYVIDYLTNSFPTQLQAPGPDGDGGIISEPVFDANGAPVHSREALEMRDRMIEKLCAMPAMPCALDQIIHRYGVEQVAEITGRSRRVIRRHKNGEWRYCLDHRPASSNIAETNAFMDDRKRILIFSGAGNTGRSYHAALDAKNQRRRIHYLLEAGWQADQAIQGLGRSHRTHQRCAPLFRPVTTDVKGELRFISTISRRLDSLGALTRGQRQTGGQGMFRPEDNLESVYAISALRGFFSGLAFGRLNSISLNRFEEMTGLHLLDRDGTLREDLPPITRFLNRILALPIATQNAIFAEFEGMIAERVERAIAAGTYERGIETLQAESFKVVERFPIYEDPETGATTQAVRVEETVKVDPMTFATALDLYRDRFPLLLVNKKSGRAALGIDTTSSVLDDGSVIPRVRLIRPVTSETITAAEVAKNWEKVPLAELRRVWDENVAATPRTKTREIVLITGLLLPIWNHLPDDQMVVYRLQTDDGERMLGRLLTPDQLRMTARSCGVSMTARLTGAQVWDATMTRGERVVLKGDRILRRSIVAQGARLELVGHNPTDLDTLKRLGCFTEVIQWRTRVFIPDAADRAVIIEKVMQIYPAE